MKIKEGDKIPSVEFFYLDESGPKKIKSLKFLQTREYEGFPTDLQAQFMALLCKADGRSVICDLSG